MLKEIIIIIGMTFLPFLELRASIPYGIFKTDIHWALVFILAIVSNILLSFFVYIFVNYIMHLFLRIKYIKKLYDKYVSRTQNKIEPYINKYGKIGLALFIGVPLPGSGVYSGGLAAYLLGFNLKDYIKASIVGVIIAGIIVTILSLFGNKIITDIFLISI